MGSRWRVFVGLLLTLIGLTFLISNVPDVGVEVLCVRVGAILRVKRRLACSASWILAILDLQEEILDLAS